MAAAKPWMKFYPQDWRADEKLRMCSLAARGLWMEMLAIMHRSERYGQLYISGRVPTDAQLAMQVGALPDQVSALVAELEEAGVFSRTASSAIYSRRMTRDARKAETARKNGNLGGNPNLRKQKDKSASVNLADKPQDNGGLKAQRPEARSSHTNVSGAEAPKLDHVKAIFDEGVTLIGGSKSDRALIGRWRNEFGDAAVLTVINTARSSGRDKTDIKGFMIGCLKRGQVRQQDEGEYLKREAVRASRGLQRLSSSPISINQAAEVLL